MPPPQAMASERGGAKPSAQPAEAFAFGGAGGGGGSSSARPSFAQPGLQTNVVAESRALQAAAASAGPASVSDATALGAGKDTVYRDRKGRKLEMLTEMMSGPTAGGADPAKPSWGTGLAQQRNKEEQRERNRADGAGPLARYEIDSATDAEKRGVMRFDDPMAQHLSKKAPASNKPKYRGPAPPPNRFDLPPGYRWDGVDRSNGYEKQFFQAQAQARREAETARSWAVEDM